MKKLLIVSLLALSTTSFANGELLYKSSCFVCHDSGIAGAPKLGDKAMWAPRIATGPVAMVNSVMHGKGAMPPKGGSTMSESEIRDVVKYMLSKVN